MCVPTLDQIYIHTYIYKRKFNAKESTAKTKQEIIPTTKSPKSDYLVTILIKRIANLKTTTNKYINELYNIYIYK